MMSMNVWKRATLAIVRKPVRSGIIGLLMLMEPCSRVALALSSSSASCICTAGLVEKAKIGRAHV